MTELEKLKRNFRNSKVWKLFRHQKNVEQNGLCFITLKKLNKRSNLHHLDLNPAHYADLSNPDNFVFLNKSMHDVVHALYRYYAKDPKIIDRLIFVLNKMKEINE